MNNGNKLHFFFPNNRYQDLMDKGEERKRKLEDSIQRYSLLRDAHELESWINDKVSVCQQNCELVKAWTKNQSFSREKLLITSM